MNGYWETIFLKGASVWAPILLERFQNRSRFEIKYRKTCPFTSEIGSSNPTLKDMYLYFFSLINVFATVLYIKIARKYMP